MGTSARHEVGAGPDWQDTLESLRAIEAYHQVKCIISVMPDASRRDHLQVVLSASAAPSSPTMADVGELRIWGVDGSLPTGGLSSFASRVWSMTVELDHLLSRERWRQQSLPDEVW